MLYDKYKTLLYTTLLYTLLIGCFVVVDSQNRGTILPLGQIIKGVEPYADSNTGVCELKFIVKAPIDLDGGGITTECTVTSSLGLVTCAIQGTEIYYTATHYSFKGVMLFGSTGSINTFTDLVFTVKKTIDLSDYSLPLYNTDGTPFTFTCEAQPFSPSIVESLKIHPKPIIGQIYFSSAFQGAFKISNAFSRPITGDFICKSTDYFCSFEYVSVDTLLFKVNYQPTFQNEDSGVVIINYPNAQSTGYMFNNTLVDNTIATLTLNHYNEFKLTPYWGYLLDTSLSSNDIFPPVTMQMSPLYGTSKKDLKFSVKLSQTTPRLIQSNGQNDPFLKTIPPLSTSNTVILSPPTTDFGDTFMEIEFDSNAMFTMATSLFQTQFQSFYPFGLVSWDGTKRRYRFPVVFDASIDYIVYNFNVPDIISLSRNLGQTRIDNSPPVINNIEIILLNDTHSVLRISASDVGSGVHKINTDIQGYQYITKRNLVSGTILNGVWEIIVPLKKSFYAMMSIIDYSGQETLYTNQELNLKFGLDLLETSSHSLGQLDKFYFSPPQIDVTYVDVHVTLYANISQTKLQREQYASIRVTLIYSNIKLIYLEGRYNNENALYEFPFKVPAHTPPGPLLYGVSINGQIFIESFNVVSKFGSSASLEILNSGVIDVSSPHVTSVIKIADQSNPLIWELEFYDISGVEKVVVGITSEYDIQGRNFTYNGNGATDLTIRVTYPMDTNSCRTMKYWISYIYTEDKLGNQGESIRYSNTDIHPFFKFDDSVDDVIQLTSLYCTSTTPETNPPEIKELTTSVTTNSTIQNQQARVLFDVQDGSNISIDHLPVCFFTSKDNEIVSSVSKVIDNSGNTVTFACDFIFPYTFYSKVLLSIYGITDIHFNFIGYSTTDLKNLGLNPIYSIPTSVSLVVIESTSSLEESLDVFYIYGRGFIPGSTIVQIEMDNENVTLTPNIISGSVLVLYNIKSSSEYKVKVVEQFSQSSSLVVLLKGPPSPSSSSSSRSDSLQSSSSSSNNPTSPPATCKTDCGASLGYGVCKGTTCVCIIPHSGLDCLSTIANTTIEPNINQPSVNLTFPSSSTQFSSFIALLSINELDSNGIVSNHIFNNDKWVIIPSTQPDDVDVRTINYKYIIDNSLQTTIYSTVQVFANSKTIVFGKQQLQMNPSTVKFTFNITAYPFSKSTNSLQLLMSASFLSNQEIGCSYQEFIQDNTDSQYLKIQIDQISLFGRFIGYGIIDGREESITNTIVDQVDEKQTSKSQQTYIGLNVRYFKQNVLLDPDFSVLIESKSANDQANAICSMKSSSKLTTPQIAGIVVGGVVFLFIIGALSFYFISKRTSSPIILKLRKIAKN